MHRILILTALLTLSGCNYVIWPESRTSNANPDAADPMVYRDRATGCDYLTRGNGASALTPRIAADGKTHMGCRAVAP